MTAAEGPFRAGAAAANVDPPLGLPLVGVVRRAEPARERLGPLEVTAAAFEHGATRVVVCGVDTLAIQSPEVDAIRERIAAATGAARAGVLLNWNHTHHAPPGGVSVYGSFGERDPEPDEATLAYVERLHDAIVATCALAFERLEDASVRWGLGRLESAVNRRQRDPDGMVRDDRVEPRRARRPLRAGAPVGARGRERDRDARRLRRAHGHDRRRATSATRPTIRAGCASRCARSPAASASTSRAPPAT